MSALEDTNSTKAMSGAATGKVITTRTARVSLDESGVVRLVMFPRAEETLEDAMANFAACNAMAGRESYLALVDIRELRTHDRAARAYYASRAVAARIVAVALLVGSPLTRMIANFYMTMQRPSNPARIFTSEAEAIKWLTGFVGHPRMVIPDELL